MTDRSSQLPRSPLAPAELLNVAASFLKHESPLLPELPTSAPASQPNPAPSHTVDWLQLGQQALGLLVTSLPALTSAPSSHANVHTDRSGALPLASGIATFLRDVAARVSPLGSPATPPISPDPQAFRSQANELLDALLVTLRRATSEEAAPPIDGVPHVWASAPVDAGGTATATLCIENNESAPADISLYSSNFIADSGSEISSLRVAPSPRVAKVPPSARASFSIEIAVPVQTAPGVYSGLIQAMGSRYVKVVLSVQVR